MPKTDVLRLNWPEAVLLSAPFIVYLYPAVALLSAKSQTPVFFGIYSSKLLTLNVLNVSAYCGFVLGFSARRRRVQFGAMLLLTLLTFVATNNSALALPAFDFATQLTRLLAGFALVVIAFLADKERAWRAGGFAISIGVLVFFTAAIDIAFSSIAAFAPSDTTKQLYGRYRTAYDLSKTTNKDIVLVGDSFVWGQGVPVVEQRFGDVLERRLNAESTGGRVYSLGIVGVGLQGYIRQVQDLPASAKVRQVVIAFYANDMPPHVNLQNTLQEVATSVSTRSLTFRAIADVIRVAVTPNREAYAKLLLKSFDETHSTFGLRWHQLEAQLTELFQLAAARSQERPMVLVLPMIVDFDKGAFDAPLNRVGELAERIGFRVLQAMPAFRADGRKAESYRAAPNDLHLNQRGNKIVADVLFGALSRSRLSSHD